MNLWYETVNENPSVQVLHILGTVDHSNYLCLIDQAKRLFDKKTRCLFMDLESCTSLSISGIFALYSVALIAHQLEPLQPEAGWDSLHRLSENEYCLKEKLKIIHPNQDVSKTLKATGLLDSLEVFMNVPSALQALQAHP